MNHGIDESKPGRDAGKIIAKTTARVLALPSDQVLDEFDKVQTALLGSDLDDYSELEIRRRIAEAKISVLATRKNSTIELEQAWADIESLGYSNSEREATMLFYRAKSLIESRQDERSVEDLLGRLDQLVSSGFGGDRVLVDHFAKVCRNLRNEFQS